MEVGKKDENELDPRIQIELENLNKYTDEINKLEIELDEANTTFRMLLNESTRRLKLLSKKMGSCIERARPYYDAFEINKNAQVECQKAAVLYQRANEIHAAAKETVALAEERFISNKHEWQFDNAWQEMLNHATIKVMEAENNKAESGREHQRKAALFSASEKRLQQLEDQLHRQIIKSRPYFEEKSLCQEQLNTQKSRIETLKNEICKVKTAYSESLKNLEQISNEIHLKRKGLSLNENDILNHPREPGVGAELNETNKYTALPDFNKELDKCEVRSLGSYSETASSVMSEQDEHDYVEENLNNAISKRKELTERPIDGGGEGRSSDAVWENELESTGGKFDHMLLVQNCSNKTDINTTKDLKNQSDCCDKQTAAS